MKFSAFLLAMLMAYSINVVAQDIAVPESETITRSGINATTQKYEVGFGVGSSYNTAYRNTGPGFDAKAPRHTQLAFSTVVTTNIKSWQFGLTTGYNKVAAKYIDTRTWVCILGPWPGSNNEIWQQPTVNDVLSYSYIPLKVFTNKKYYIGSICVYGGMSAGATVPVKIVEAIGRPKEPFFKGMLGYVNVTAGVQAGVTVPVGAQIGFNVEAAATYVNMYNGLFTYAFPVTTGIRYRF